MSRAKKVFEASLKRTDELPDSWFGGKEASLEDLPSVLRRNRVRKNIFIEKATADKLEQFCQKRGVSFTDIANDILTKYVSSQGKKKIG